MITTSAPPRRNRIFEIALVLSILTHLLILLVYLGIFARLAPLIQPVTKEEERDASSDVIHLEKRNVPEAETVAPPPKPRPVAQQAPAPAIPVARPIAAAKPRVQREVARIVPRAPVLPRSSARTAAAPAPQTVALSPSAPQGSGQTSAQDSAATQQQRFRDAIAQANASIRNFVPPNIPPAAIVPRANQGRLSFEQLKRGYGTVDYVYQSGRSGDYNWYIIRVWITYPDGKTELVNIPWRFYFPRGHDPIAVHDSRPFPAQPPPDGFVLPHPFDPSRFVCSFYPTECQALFDAEQRSGGPAAN
jgi:hypothetical protein